MPINAPKSKLTDSQWEELIELWKNGETLNALGRRFDIRPHSIKKRLLARQVIRPEQRPKASQYLNEFVKRAHSLLWRQNQGIEHPVYDTWKARVEELESEDGAGMSYGEAVIRASKEYPCLYRLFREYDVREFDPHPESHAAIQHFGEAAKAMVTLNEQTDVIIDGRELSYRDNLSWAITAAGEHLRTRQHPGLCPNDAAWYLYMQAIENPKDFMTRIGQIESKVDNDGDSRAINKSGKRTVAELDAMLEQLEERTPDEKLECETEAESEAKTQGQKESG